MKLAIMQPYFFPYLGYFQLIAAADRFVLLDDANFIKQGWVNRNAILGAQGPLRITVPVSDASSNRRICDLSIASEGRWREKMSRSIEQAYRRAPCFDAVWPWMSRVIQNPSENLADFLRQCLTAVLEYMRISTEIVPSSRVYRNDDVSGEARVIDICRREAATDYINSSGGVSLYCAGNFHASDLSLHFLHHDPMPYRQSGKPFVPRLSILDALMFNPPERLRLLLGQYRLESYTVSAAPISAHG